MKQFFNPSECIEKSNCINANSFLCDTCNRNLRQLTDNFKLKGLEFTCKNEEEVKRK